MVDMDDLENRAQSSPIGAQWLHSSFPVYHLSQTAKQATVQGCGVNLNNYLSAAEVPMQLARLQ